LEAVLGKLMLQGIKVAPGNATGLGRLGYGVPLSRNAPEHCILHLEGVIWSKKGRGREQRGLHLLRSRMQGARRRQVCAFMTQGGDASFHGVEEALMSDK
jgi:hypothetical protein